MSERPVPVSIAVLTVSDTRTEETDTSGRLLVERLLDAGHTLHDKRIVPDEANVVRHILETWRDDPACDVILTTGGTGITGRDVTVDVVETLFTKAIVGFGELFRALSYFDIGPSTIQSRATAGLAQTTLIFSLPGSTGACELGWQKILSHQLDSTSRPCNLVALMPRFAE